MNIAFYIDNIGQSEQNEKIFECMNEAVEYDLVSDASLFYNNISYNPYDSKFGIFNSTDIWNYTGLLIATTINNVNFAHKIVNKFKLAYLYQKDSNILGLIDTINKLPVITIDEDSQKEIYRLTGKKPIRLNKLNIKNIIEVLK